jgi:acetyl esterase/lipase
LSTVVRDLVYAHRPHGPLLADVFQPDGSEAPGLATAGRPAIIWLHGGGWRFGNRRQAPPLERYYAQRGYVMVSIDYRRSTEALFPAAVLDLKTAIRWLKSSAGEYGLDPQRIGLWGSSAGGHLAALAAISHDGQFEDLEYPEHDSSVAAVVNAYGPCDFLQMDAQRDPLGTPSDDIESIQMPAGKKSADADSFESLFLGAPIESCPDLVSAANPVSYMRSALPPFLLLHGRSDTAVPWQQSQLLYRSLASHGNDVTLGMIRKLGHGFLNRKDLDAVDWDVEISTIRRSPRLVRKRVFELIGSWFDLNL